jgi:putative endonuclease
LGRRGERAAAQYLKRRGLRILVVGERSQTGELDLVAIDGRTVVFVEVKTRRHLGTGHPADAVDRAKQTRLVRQGLQFLKRHGLLEQPARFDVVAVLWPRAARRPTIEHFANAFEPPGQGQMYG